MRSTLGGRPASAARRGRSRRGIGGSRFIARASPASLGGQRRDGGLERAAAGGVVHEHVEARGGRAEQHGRRPPGARRPRASASRAIASARRTAVVEVARRAPSGPGRPPGTRPRASGPLSPMRTAATARSATTGASAARSMPLSRPPAISTIGGSKARSAATTASGWVPCESLMNRTPSMTRDRLEPVLDAGERRRPRCGSPSGAIPNASADGDRGQRVRDVVGARDGELGDGHDPAVATARTSPAVGRERERLDAVRDDPAVDDAEPARQRRVAAVADRPRAVAESAYVATTGSSSLRTSAPSGSTSSAEPALDPPIRLERPVPVEMVRRDVGVDGHGRAARQRRQLELGQLVDDAMLRRQLEQPLDDRDPDVAAEHDRVGRIGGQQRRGQRGRRGLALGAGHADGRRRAEAQEQVRLGDERRDRRGRRRPAPSTSARQRGAQARLGRREVGRDRGRRGDERRPPPRSRPGRRPARAPAPPAARRAPRSRRRGRRPAGRRRPSPAPRRPTGSAPGRARCGPARGPSPAGRAGRRPGSRRGRARRGRSVAGRHRRHCSRSSEARKSVTPSSAARIPTIQKRIVIFSSSQPPSSKWWWIGLIRKSRLPPDSLK